MSYTMSERLVIAHRSKLLDRVSEIAAYAEDNGWVSEHRFETIDGAESIQLYGTRTDWHPDTPSDTAVTFGFSVAFCVRQETGRTSAMCLDGKAGAVFVVTVEDGSGRYWLGPLRSWRDALADPSDWTGVEIPGPGEIASR